MADRFTEKAREVMDALNRCRSAIQGGYPTSESPAEIIEKALREERQRTLEDAAKCIDDSRMEWKDEFLNASVLALYIRALDDTLEPVAKQS